MPEPTEAEWLEGGPEGGRIHEAETRTDREREHTERETCPACNGSGKAYGARGLDPYACWKCHGRGFDHTPEECELELVGPSTERQEPPK